MNPENTSVPTSTQAAQTAHAEVTTQSDPFANVGQQPATQSTAQQPPEPPTQTTTPAPQPENPTQPTNPQPETPPETPKTDPQATQPLTGKEYDEQVTKDLEAIKAPEAPDVSTIDQNDMESLNRFFKERDEALLAQAEARMQRQEVIRTHEQRVWGQAFEKYPTLRTNDTARNMVNDIRMAAHARGESITPAEAADRLLGLVNQNYQQGVADAHKQSETLSGQPMNGGGQPAPVNYRDDLIAVQDGGETALTSILDREIQNGRL